MKASYYFVILCFIIVGCSPEGNAEKADTVTIKSAERTFNIPRAYIDLDAKQNIIEDSVVLSYVLPDFEPQPPHPQERLKRKELILEGKMRGMLLEAASVRPSIDVMVSNTLRPNPLMPKQIYKEKPTEIIYGLEKFASQKLEPKVSNQQDDFFVERNDKGIAISFLHCTPPGKGVVPSCTQKFTDKGLLYDIDWSISELSNWREQRNAAVQFIDSFEAK